MKAHAQGAVPAHTVRGAKSLGAVRAAPDNSPRRSDIRGAFLGVVLFPFLLVLFIMVPAGNAQVTTPRVEDQLRAELKQLKKDFARVKEIAVSNRDKALVARKAAETMRAKLDDAEEQIAEMEDRYERLRKKYSELRVLKAKLDAALLNERTDSIIDEMITEESEASDSDYFARMKKEAGPRPDVQKVMEDYLSVRSSQKRQLILQEASEPQLISAKGRGFWMSEVSFVVRAPGAVEMATDRGGESEITVEYWGFAFLRGGKVWTPYFDEASLGKVFLPAYISEDGTEFRGGYVYRDEV